MTDIAHVSPENSFILIIATYLLLWIDIPKATRIVNQSRLQIARSSATFHNIYGSFMYAYIKIIVT